MNSSDSAEEIVKLSLDGMEVAFKVAGAGAKNIAVLIYTIMKDKQQTKGKTRLSNMLKSGKALKIFTIRAEDLKKFSQEAKRYGVLYCALANKKNSKIDGMVDIMVREEDASKLNRIAERFNFRDIVSIQKDLEKEKQVKQNEQKNLEIPKNEDEQFIDDIMPIERKENREIPSNNTSKTEEENPLEISLNIKSKDMEEISNKGKKTVRQELKEIEQEIKEKEQIIPKNKTMFKKRRPKHIKKQEDKNIGKRTKIPKHLNVNNNLKKKKIKIRS